MSGIEHPEWQKAYREALLERHLLKLPARIFEGETVIHIRLDALQTSSNGHIERQAIEDAIGTLLLLKHEKLDSPSWEQSWCCVPVELSKSPVLGCENRSGGLLASEFLIPIQAGGVLYRIELCVICDKRKCGAAVILSALSSHRKGFDLKSASMNLICPACDKPFTVSITEIERANVSDEQLREGFLGLA